MLLTEPAVIVPARYAAMFARLLDAHARNSGGASPGVVALLAEFRQAATALQRLALDDTATSASGTSEVPQSPDFDTLTSMDVARLINRSDRYVRQCAEREALHGRRVAGRWIFHRNDVAAFVAGRQAS